MLEPLGEACDGSEAFRTFVVPNDQNEGRKLVDGARLRYLIVYETLAGLGTHSLDAVFCGYHRRAGSSVRS
jgi:hypothetical protein